MSQSHQRPAFIDGGSVPEHSGPETCTGAEHEGSLPGLADAHPAVSEEAGGPEDKRPLWTMLKLAAPSVATMTSYTAMQYVDMLMVSKIAPDPVYVAAQGNGAVITFWPMSIAMGMIGMVNTYVSQNLGAGTPRRGPAYAWNGVWIGVAAWLLLIPYALALPYIFRLQGHDAQMIALESRYGQVLLFGACFTLAARGMSQFFYGLHRPWIVLGAALAGNLVNYFFNRLLIFGWEGAGIPAMGITGSALATVIGTCVELMIPLAVFLSAKFDREYGSRSAWRPSLAHVKDLVRTGWPAALMYGNEMICWAVFMSGLVGRFGKDENAASWITLRYMHMSFMPAVGMSFAITAVVGKCLGAKRPDLAQQRAWLGIRCAMVYMGFCALVMVLFRHELAAILVNKSLPPDEAAKIVETAGKIMIVAAVFQVFDGLGISIIGVLRAGGDTVLPGVVTMVLSWTCIIGLGGYIAFAASHLGAVGPWIGAGVYIVLLGLFLGWRFFGGKWKTQNLLGKSAVAH